MQLRKWLRRALIALLVAVAIPVCLGLFLVFGMRNELKTRYDREDPNYRYVTERLGTEIEFEQFNAGDWQFVCIIGAYNDPVKILRNEAAKRGIEVATIDPVKTQSLGLAPIEENEGAISFIDGFGRGRTVLIDGFERLIEQHGRACFGRDTKQIKLPSREWTLPRPAG